MSIADYVSGTVGIIGVYVLLPIFVALVTYIVLELIANRQGVDLSVEFHKRSFALAIAVVFGWLVYMLVPQGMYLPLDVIEAKFIVGLFMMVMTFQYVVYILSKLIGGAKTLLGMGAGAGLIRTTLAVSIVGKMCAENPDMSYEGVASIMMANTVMIMRNFVIIWIVGAWLGLYAFPPAYFVGAMVAMLLTCGAITYANHLKGGGVETEEDVEIFSAKGLLIFMGIFIVMFYLAYGIIERAGFFGLYGLSGVAGFFYGSAHLFVVASLLFAKTITLEAALIAGVVVTAGSLMSDIPYAYFAGARDLTKLLLISEAIPIAVGLGVLAYLL